MQATAYTIDRIRDEMIATGSHWWDRDTMRFFGTRCIGPVFQGEGGVYFVTSDKEYDDRKSCNVRKYDPASQQVDTVAGAIGGEGEYKGVRLSRVQALRLAQRLSGDTSRKVSSARSDNTPKVTAADQLFIDLSRNGCVPSSAGVKRLIALAKQHHGQCESQCNGTRQSVSDVLESTITRLAVDIGCKGVRFQGDPRGCTVKLLLPNGATNDWGNEGWCVPTT